tara:strand:+ start:14364 stop:14483 length:120 start_codon:yes stop_codon:yes gene_type:complete
MSCDYTQIFLENMFEEGLEQGLNEDQAAAYALEALENIE